MDPELKKLLEAAHAAGATDDDLGQLIDRWNADHTGPHGPVDISAQLQQQYDAQHPKAPPGPMAVLKSTPGAFNAPENADRRRMVGTTALGMMIPETKIATALDAIPGVGPFVARLATRAATGAGLGALAAGPGNRVSGATAGAVLNPIVSGGAGMLAKRLEPIATKLAAKGMDYATLRNALSQSVDATNAQNYERSLGLAAGREVTPAIRDVLSDPYMAPHIAAIRQLPQMQGVATTDPAFLHALYKRLSDIEGGAITGLESVEARNPNTKAETQEAARTLKDRLLGGMETAGMKPPITFDVPAETHSVAPRVTELGHDQAFGHPMTGTANQYAASPTTQAQLLRDFPSVPQRQGPAGPGFNLRANPGHVQPGVDINAPAMRVETAPAQPVPAYMPEYRGAVDQAREGFTQLDALQKGYEALPALAKATQMTPQQVQEFSIPALKDFLDGKSPESVDQLRTGIQASNNANKLVGWRRILGPIGVPLLNGTAKTAPTVLRALSDPAQLARDQMLSNGTNAAKSGFLSWLITQGYLPSDSTGGPPP